MNFAPAPMLDAFIAARYKEGNTRDVMKSGLRRCILSLLAESGSLESDTPVPGAVVTDERIRAACEEAQPGKAYYVRLLREWCVEVARAMYVSDISNEAYLEMARNEDIVRQGYDYAGCPEPAPGYKWVVMDGLGGITPVDAEEDAPAKNEACVLPSVDQEYLKSYFAGRFPHTSALDYDPGEE